jgi:hypothetical protein
MEKQTRTPMLAEIDRQLTQCEIELSGIHVLGVNRDDPRVETLFSKLKTVYFYRDNTAPEVLSELAEIDDEIESIVKSLQEEGFTHDEFQKLKKEAEQ